MLVVGVGNVLMILDYTVCLSSSSAFVEQVVSDFILILHASGIMLSYVLQILCVLLSYHLAIRDAVVGFVALNMCNADLPAKADVITVVSNIRRLNIVPVLTVKALSIRWVVILYLQGRKVGNMCCKGSGLQQFKQALMRCCYLAEVFGGKGYGVMIFKSQQEFSG